MAGAPSTPSLAAAVSGAGGLGFLAAGYTSVDALQRDIDELRCQIAADAPYGVNLFVPSQHSATSNDVTAYAQRLGADAQRRGVTLGVPRWDDDGYQDKVALLTARPVPVVSFTFGCPMTDDVDTLHTAGSAVWVTVTTVPEARAASAVGADALVVQGVEAGGHRGGFDDSHPGDIGLLALLQLVRAAVGVELPLIASGGLSTGGGVAAVLAAGAAAAQLGTAFLLSPEAGTGAVHRDLIGRGDRSTGLTRAFTGRTARSISNRFMGEHSDHAPSAYPEVHHLTSPLRAAARAAGDAEGFHLWAGQSYSLVRPTPAAEIVQQLTAEARQALHRAAGRLNNRDG
jgi:nitronate monooxygenase